MLTQPLDSCKKSLFGGDPSSPRKDWSMGFEGGNFINRRDSADSIKSQIVIFTPKGHVKSFALPTEEKIDLEEDGFRDQTNQRRTGAMTPNFAK